MRCPSHCSPGRSSPSSPLRGMQRVLRAGMAEHGISNVEIVPSRWPMEGAPAADVALVAHPGTTYQGHRPVSRTERAGRWALLWDPVSVGIVTWTPRPFRAKSPLRFPQPESRRLPSTPGERPPFSGAARHRARSGRSVLADAGSDRPGRPSPEGRGIAVPPEAARPQVCWPRCAQERDSSTWRAWQPACTRQMRTRACTAVEERR